jgi:hypothetical protein
MIAGIYNMLIEQGTTFVRSFNIQYPDPEDPEVYLNYDLTGYTARMQIRRTIDSSTAIVTCTTENGRISIDDENGVVTVSMTDEVTSAITTSGVYDLEIEDASGNVSRVVQGTVTLSPEVTRVVAP